MITTTLYFSIETFVLSFQCQNVLYGAQLARIVNPLIGPMRQRIFENFRGRLKTFLFEARTQLLFFGPDLRQFFITLFKEILV